MIVRIKHVWYQDKRYNLESPDSRDTQDFLHDMQAVTQFAGVCEIRFVSRNKKAVR